MSSPTFGEMRKNFFGGVWRALGRLIQGALLGFVVGLVVIEGLAYFFNGAQTWPPTTFTHVAALAFAVALSYAVALTVAVAEGVKGMVTVAEHLDDVAKTTIDAGVNVVDNVVDAVDGPNRHGIR